MVSFHAKNLTDFHINLLMKSKFSFRFNDLHIFVQFVLSVLEFFSILLTQLVVFVNFAFELGDNFGRREVTHEFDNVDHILLIRVIYHESCAHVIWRQ